jgi:hypothetical protein
LKKKGGNIAFGDDSSTKILGKGTVIPRKKKSQRPKIRMKYY